MAYKCASCLEHHEQILMLACNHDVCIECATHHFLQFNRIQDDFQLKKNFDNLYSCQICFSTTKLQNDSVEEIKRFAKRKTEKFQCKDLIRKSRSQNKRTQARNKGSPFRLKLQKKIQSPKLSSTSSSEHFQLLKFGQAEQIKNSRVTKKNKQKYLLKTEQKLLPRFDDLCDQHPDERKAYYCFKCEKGICAECAIHGKHVGHEVEAIKKARKRLVGNYEDFLLTTQKYGFIVASLGEQVQTVMESVQQWKKRQKNALQSRFKELPETLYEKEQKLLSQLDEQENTNLGQLSIEKQHFNRLSMDFKEKRKNIKDSLTKDISSWNFSELLTQKQDIERLGKKISEISHRDSSSQIVYLNSDLIEEAIQGIERLVNSFHLNIRNKDLQGTATFQIS